MREGAAGLGLEAAGGLAEPEQQNLILSPADVPDRTGPRIESPPARPARRLRIILGAIHKLLGAAILAYLQVRERADESLSLFARQPMDPDVTAAPARK
jgi:hypothetical protein